MAGIVAIYTAPEAGAEPISLTEVRIEAGRGIVGDRYYRRQGTFSEKLRDGHDWHITLIEIEEIERFNAAFGTGHAAGQFRRNVVTTGIRLNDLVGRRFALGDAKLVGMRLCEPCAYLAGLLGAAVLKGMAHKAGLRARIDAGAIVRPGDRISDLGAADLVEISGRRAPLHPQPAVPSPDSISPSDPSPA